jgi:hypothetical protein
VCVFVSRVSFVSGEFSSIFPLNESESDSFAARAPSASASRGWYRTRRRTTPAPGSATKASKASEGSSPSDGGSPVAGNVPVDRRTSASRSLASSRAAYRAPRSRHPSTAASRIGASRKPSLRAARYPATTPPAVLPKNPPTPRAALRATPRTPPAAPSPRTRVMSAPAGASSSAATGTGPHCPFRLASFSSSRSPFGTPRSELSLASGA